MQYKCFCKLLTLILNLSIEFSFVSYSFPKFNRAVYSIAWKSFRFVLIKVMSKQCKSTNRQSAKQSLVRLVSLNIDNCCNNLNFASADAVR